jgi:predicted dehydrogenase
MIGETLRLLPAVRVVKECLDSGCLGEPGLLRIHWWEPSIALSQSLDPLLSELTRAIDLACWLFDERPTAVYATGRPNYVQLHLGFERGGMALLDHARTLPPGCTYFSASLIGSTGATYADDHHNTQLLFARGGPSALITGQGDERREIGTAAVEDLRVIQAAEAVSASLTSGQALRWTGQQYELVGP